MAGHRQIAWVVGIVGAVLVAGAFGAQWVVGVLHEDPSRLQPRICVHEPREYPCGATPFPCSQRRCR